MRAILFCLLVSVSVCGQEKFDISASSDYQKQLNKEYADPKESPLEQQDLKEFKGLEFFPVDAKYIVQARLIRTESERPFEMKTTGSRRPMYVKFGEAHFSIDGKACRLNIYKSLDFTKRPGHEDALFLPFSDVTCGRQSYIGGRYIDLTDPKRDEITIDFNRAYNPYCAYNHNYSCPVVPLDNDLPVEIRAGVKKFHD